MDKVISLRVEKGIYDKMRKIDYINWSAILRRALIYEISKVEEDKREKMKRASENIDNIRESGRFDKGKTGVEIIREWRNKRKF